MWETPYLTAHTDLYQRSHVSDLLPYFFSDPINPARVRHRRTVVLMASLEFLFAPRAHQESNIVVAFAVQALSASSCFIVNVDLGNWSFLRFWCCFGCRNHSLRFQRWATKSLMTVQRSKRQQQTTVATFNVSAFTRFSLAARGSS